LAGIPTTLHIPAATAPAGNFPPDKSGGAGRRGDKSPSGETPPPASLPEGLRVLVVEQNSILALDVEDMLLRNGAALVTVAGSVADALAVLAVEHFDAALLDLKVVARGSLTVAGRLDELAVPFAFVSDYGERPTLPPAFAQRPILGKPCSEHYLVSRLLGLLTPT
jgi:CheY-like chemotaxis protein